MAGDNCTNTILIKLKVEHLGVFRDHRATMARAACERHGYI